MVLTDRWIWFLWMYWACRLSGVLTVGIGVDTLIFERNYLYSWWLWMLVGVGIFCFSGIFWILWNDRLSTAVSYVLAEGDEVLIRSLELGVGRRIAVPLVEKLIETRGEPHDLGLAMAIRAPAPTVTYHWVRDFSCSKELVNLEKRGLQSSSVVGEFLTAAGFGIGFMVGELVLSLSRGFIEGRLLFAFLMGFSAGLATLLAVPKRRRFHLDIQNEADRILGSLSINELEYLTGFGFVGKSAKAILIKKRHL